MHTCPLKKEILYIALCAVMAVFVLSIGGCATQHTQEPELRAKTVRVDESPQTFVSHLSAEGQHLQSWRSLEPSLRKSLDYVNSKPPTATAVVCDGRSITWADMAQTLHSLCILLPLLDKQPEIFLQRFMWLPISGGIDYSGYYEPAITASRTYKKGYHPLYRRPADLNKTRARGKRYYSRKAIDGDGVLKNKGLELAWAKDIVDVFYLQIQGSGKLLFDDGSFAYVNYDGQNGHKYVSSGRIMREKGLLEQGNIFEQRQWFKKNPERVWEILQENPSYVFFKFGTHGSVGAMGAVIEPWVSLATSRGTIPLGSIVAYGVNVPTANGQTNPLRGIGLAQDVGGAIKGKRIDIFCGSGAEAEYAASHLDAKGPAWILVDRKQ